MSNGEQHSPYLWLRLVCDAVVKLRRLSYRNISANFLYILILRYHIASDKKWSIIVTQDKCQFDRPGSSATRVGRAGTRGSYQAAGFGSMSKMECDRVIVIRTEMFSC